MSMVDLDHRPMHDESALSTAPRGGQSPVRSTAMPVRRTALALLFLCALTGCAGGSMEATVDGASLSSVKAGDGRAYLQRIDLRRMRIEQVTGERDGGAAEKGRYHPDAGSPRFLRIPPAQVRTRCQSDGFSIVNFAFFE